MKLFLFFTLISFCSASQLNITCLSSCPGTLPYHTSLPIFLLYAPGKDLIDQAKVSISSPDNTQVYYSEVIQWTSIPQEAAWATDEFTLFYKFILSPETQNVPLEKTSPVNILVTWKEVEESNRKIVGAASTSLPLVITNLKPNIIIGITNSAHFSSYISNWFLFFLLLQNI